MSFFGHLLFQFIINKISKIEKQDKLNLRSNQNFNKEKQKNKDKPIFDEMLTEEIKKLTKNKNH
ncbi:MAG: hypothetical protein GX903_11710 [Spirochaetales bacterium]|nr:hypothetical protein [Spirochaetales bacterium]